MINNSKGITLASLTIYVIVATVVLGILAFLNIQFIGNINELSDESTIVSEKLNFKTALLRDIKSDEELRVLEYNNNLIRFSNNVQYEIRKNDSNTYAIFRNDVKICSKIYPTQMEGRNTPYFDFDSGSGVLKLGIQFAETQADTRNSNYRESGTYLIGRAAKIGNAFATYKAGTGSQESIINYYSNNGKNEYAYQYKAKGGITNLYGTSETQFTVPVGYRLGGWMKRSTSSTPDYLLNALYSGDNIDLFAYWEEYTDPAEKVNVTVVSNYPKSDGTTAEAGDVIDMRFSATFLDLEEFEFPYKVEVIINVTDRNMITIENSLLVAEGITYTFNPATNSYVFTWEMADASSEFQVLATVNDNVPAGSKVNISINGAKHAQIPAIPIESTVSIQREMADKNIVMVFDTSSSMSWCTKSGHSYNNSVYVNGEQVGCLRCGQANLSSTNSNARCSRHGTQYITRASSVGTGGGYGGYGGWRRIWQ